MSNLAYVETYLDMAAEGLNRLMLAGEVRKTANLRQLVYRFHDAQEELSAVRAGMDRIFNRKEK